jgi:hypothetical protein
MNYLKSTAPAMFILEWMEAENKKSPLSEQCTKAMNGLEYESKASKWRDVAEQLAKERYPELFD